MVQAVRSQQRQNFPFRNKYTENGPVPYRTGPFLSTDLYIKSSRLKRNRLAEQNPPDRLPDHGPIRLLAREFTNTFRADEFALEFPDIIGFPTENTGRRILFQYNLIPVHKNFDGIPFVDVQSATELNGKYNASQIIHLADNTSRFHRFHPFQYADTNGKFPRIRSDSFCDLQI